MIDWNGKDVLEFNMSKNIGVGLPLLCQPHPYKFHSEKKWFASFVGSRTHPIRNELEKLRGKEGYYLSYDPHDIETYCRILHESVFALCPRGYAGAIYGLKFIRVSIFYHLLYQLIEGLLIYHYGTYQQLFLRFSLVCSVSRFSLHSNYQLRNKQ